MFNAYIATSPSLLYDNQALLREAGAYLDGMMTLNKFLFISVGNEQRVLLSLNAFTEILKNKAPRDLLWEFQCMEDENHLSIPPKSIREGMKALYSDWRLPYDVLVKMGFEEIREHYEA